MKQDILPSLTLCATLYRNIVFGIGDIKKIMTN
jgi:hypothetical protein